MLWTDSPESVLVVRKHSDCNVIDPFCQMTSWLVKDMGLKVYVEESDLADSCLDQTADFKDVKKELILFVESKENNTSDLIDLVICLGSDRTLLHASSMFQGQVPPVMAINVGSRGFLTAFQFGPDFRQYVSEVIEGSPSILFRYRLDCALDNGAELGFKKGGNSGSSIKTQRLVLNEVVVSRGPSSTQSNFEILIGNRLVTSLQGDGLIMSTPTGSTAYSVSAGASMVHPGVPCVLITPICPHSLSFRPVIVPAGVQIQVKLCGDSTDSTCMVCFDGKERQEMGHGEVLRVSTARHPLPSICSTNQTEDWFDGLDTCLNWNSRLSQKPMGTKTGGPNTTTTAKEIPQSSFKGMDSNSNSQTTTKHLENKCETQQGKIGNEINNWKSIVINENMVKPEKLNGNTTGSVTEDGFQQLSDGHNGSRGDATSPKLCQKSIEMNVMNSKSIDSSVFEVPQKYSESKDKDDDVLTSSRTSKLFPKSRDHKDTRKYSIINLSSPRLPQIQFCDRETYHNTLNSSSTEGMAKFLKIKDSNFNDVAFISSDGNRIPHCICDNDHKELYHSPVKCFPCYFVEDSHFGDSFVNSNKPIKDENLNGPKRTTCDRTLPTTVSEECSKSVKNTHTSIYNKCVNSLTMDVPQKDTGSLISPVKSFIAGTDNSQTAPTAVS